MNVGDLVRVIGTAELGVVLETQIDMVHPQDDDAEGASELSRGATVMWSSDGYIELLYEEELEGAE
jgi:hypothetical protein